MNMLSVEQVAEKWNVSARTVQNFCKTGRIPGAVTFGKSWMIPANAQKPKDGRCKKNKNEAEISSRITIPVKSPLMIMSKFYNKSGNAEKGIASLAAVPEVATLFEGELAFIQGHIEKARKLILPLFNVEFDFYGTLNVGIITSAIAMWENDSALWKKSREHMTSLVCADDSERKIRDLWLKITDFANPSGMQSLTPSSWTAFADLPEDSLPMYLFYYAKYMHKLGVDLARKKTVMPDIQGVGVLRMFPYLAEPLIAQVHSIGAVLPEIYLHFLCADAYNKIGSTEKSEQHLDIAVSLSLPDKLYGVLAEYRGLISAAIDENLAKRDNAAARKTKKLDKKIYANWIAITSQNSDYGLSSREKEIAILVSIGLSNNEIAERLKISSHTVKTTISMIMNKTGCTKRSEFSLYIF